MSRWPRSTALALAFAAALPAAAARAAIIPEAQAIVDRYVAATGGRAALTAEHALHEKGRLNTLSLRGSYEHWIQDPNRVRERIDLGSMRIERGFDGVTGWRVDLTSKRATMLSGKELENLRSVAYFAAEAWARPDQGGGKVMIGPSGFRDGEQFCSLDVTPPVGPACKLWFSVRTGLLTRSITRDDNAESESWYSEYRLLAGRQRPTVESSFDPAMHLTLDPHEDADAEQSFTDSIWVNPALDSSRFAPPATAEASVTWEKTRGVASVPFRYGASLVWVRGSINGAPPADFIIDTGASMTVLDRQYAEEIGLGHEGTAGVQGMGGGGSVSFAPVKSFRIGGIGDGVALRDLRVGLTDLGDSGDPVVWRRMCGLIGYDILSRFVVEVDYDRRLVTFRDPQSFTYQGKGQPVDMTLVVGIPVVRVKLDDQCEGDFFVDVGNSVGVLLHGSLVRRCQLFDTVRGHKQLPITSGGVGDYFMSWVTRLDKLTIGPYVVAKPVVGMSLGTHGLVGSSDYGGNIGANVLEQFTCTFDYQRQKLYLEPGKAFGTPGHFSRSGSMFLRLRHKVVVGSIMRGSAADDAGLKLDDEVTLIDDKPALAFTSEDMDRLFENGEPGTQHTLTILREGKSRTVTLTLKDAL